MPELVPGDMEAGGVTVRVGEREEGKLCGVWGQERREFLPGQDTAHAHCTLTLHHRLLQEEDKIKQREARMRSSAVTLCARVFSAESWRDNNKLCVVVAKLSCRSGDCCYSMLLHERCVHVLSKGKLHV